MRSRYTSNNTSEIIKIFRLIFILKLHLITFKTNNYEK